MLLVESDPVEASRTLDALRDVRLGDGVQMVERVEDAVLFLRRLPPYQYVSRPDVVLLGADVRDPAARTLLEMLAEDPELTTVRVVVMAPRRTREGVARLCASMADACVGKPVDADELGRVVRGLNRRRFQRRVVRPDDAGRLAKPVARVTSGAA